MRTLVLLTGLFFFASTADATEVTFVRTGFGNFFANDTPNLNFLALDVPPVVFAPPRIVFAPPRAAVFVGPLVPRVVFRGVRVRR